MIEDLLLANDNKIVFLVLDGLGDIPNPGFSYKTPLEAAKTPNMDNLSLKTGILGRILPVDIGITPGSGPGHLSLFGYDPVQYEIGRGVLEVLGLNMDLQAGDLAARANFCTMENGVVIDRRAGRIETKETERLCETLAGVIPEIEGVRVIIKPGKSHRFAIIFRGKGLSDKLTDADPHKDNKPFKYASSKSGEAELSSKTVNAFMAKALDVLKRREGCKRGSAAGVFGKARHTVFFRQLQTQGPCHSDIPDVQRHCKSARNGR